MAGGSLQARLRTGYNLYTSIRNRQQVEIYVPGSRHSHEGIDDPLSLSESGTSYLQKMGIPPDHLRGDELNHCYLGDDGVYNSEAECFVTASYFRDSSSFGSLGAVVSPFQVTRKLAYYVKYGVLPKVHTVSVADPFHSLVDELFLDIPEAMFGIDREPSWKRSRFSSRRP